MKRPPALRAGRRTRTRTVDGRFRVFHGGGPSAPRNVGNRLLDSGCGLATDPLVLPAAVAGATTRLRLLTSVLVAPYYPALVLANQAATLDVVSGGRLVLGVGTGWNPDEFAAVGVPARERGARTDDHLAAARTLWTRRPADLDGPFTTLRAAHLGVPRSPPAVRPCGSAATATPPCAARCASATAGTAPVSTPRRSPTYDAACADSPARRTPTAPRSSRPRSSRHPACPRRSRHRDGRSAAPPPPRRASPPTSPGSPRQASPPAPCGCPVSRERYRSGERWYVTSGTPCPGCRRGPCSAPARPLSGGSLRLRQHCRGRRLVDANG
ncbi:LLM class flavin-dependent oxidoreductase [Streptomyces sp. NPDC088760]|uniref:LLM class flavin-dependent oxidoreductase n=1 Tax=Streptomyces sp. NPDC088760 TaxID=3365890 RepID=UPI0038018D70